MMRMRFSNAINKEYLEIYLSSEIGRSKICRNAKAAVNQASINQADIYNTPVPLPPKQEQANVVSAVGDALESDLSVGWKDLKTATSTLRQAILAAAFRGELTA